jgi:hypothetical protein
MVCSILPNKNFVKPFSFVVCFLEELWTFISTSGGRLCQPNYYWLLRFFRSSYGPDTYYIYGSFIAVGESQQAIGHAPGQVDVQLEGNHEKTAGQRRHQRQGVIGKSYFSRGNDHSKLNRNKKKSRLNLPQHETL